MQACKATDQHWTDPKREVSNGAQTEVVQGLAEDMAAQTIKGMLGVQRGGLRSQPEGSMMMPGETAERSVKVSG